MRAYLLVLEVTPMDVGKTYAMLPLHCTLVHWFWLDLDPADFAKQLELAARHTSSLLLKSDKEAIYTAKTKHDTIPVTVTTIELTPDLKKLHLTICDALDKMNVHYTYPQYVKEGYSPHITHQKGAKFPVGASHTSTAIYVVAADAPEYGNDRRICSKIKLLE